MYNLLKRLYYNRKSPLAREVFDVHFKTPVGVRSKFDPNAEHCNSLSDYGFSFIEIGPISPEPQHHIIPNKGAIAVACRLRRKKYHRAFIAANICKNPATDIEQAAHDYEFCFTHLYDYVDMFVVNLSEKDVPGTRQLQDTTFLSDIVDRLLYLRLYFNEYKPILIQISDDLSHLDIDDIIHYVRSSGVDGIVTDKIENIRYIAEKTQGRLPIVSKCDFFTPQQAIELFNAGASLLEASNPMKGAAVNLKLRRIYRKKKSI